MNMLPETVLERHRTNYETYRDVFSAGGYTEEIASRVWQRMLAPGAWDAYHLFREARKIPNGGRYCEVGSAWGGSLLCAYEGVKAAGNTAEFVCVEQDVKPEFRTLAESIGAKIVEGDCRQVHDTVPGPFDLLVIDGSHEYDHAGEDIRLYLPKVRKGGVVLVHDFNWQSAEDGAEDHLGVVKAVLLWLYDREVTHLANSVWAKVVV